MTKRVKAIALKEENKTELQRIAEREDQETKIQIHHKNSETKKSVPIQKEKPELYATLQNMSILIDQDNQDSAKTFWKKLN